MNKFLPTSHIRLKLPCGLLGGILCLLLIFSLEDKDAVMTAAFLCLLILLLITARRLSKCGLYVSEDKLFYQSFTRKLPILPASIAAIKKSAALVSDLYSPLHPMKDRAGNALYTAILVNSAAPDMQGHKDGDLRFLQEFRRQIICRCVYDQETVDYLLTRNPNIVVWQ